MQKKRAGPEKVHPVIIDGVRYEAIHWGKARGLEQNGGYIAAIDDLSGKELWILKVYNVNYDSDMEADKLDIFITRISKDRKAHHLKIENERDGRYVVDLRTRLVS